MGNDSDKRQSKKKNKFLFGSAIKSMYSSIRWPQFIQNYRKKKAVSEKVQNRYKKLEIEIAKTLDEKANVNIDAELSQLSNLEQFLEMQNKGLNPIFMFLGVMVICALILMGIPGCDSPGVVEVETRYLEFVLKEDFEWTGKIDTQTKSYVLLSNFEQVYSPNIPEILVQESDQVVGILSNRSAIVESLIIPAGAKVMVNWEPNDKTLSLEMAVNDNNFAFDQLVRVEFQTEGKVSVESDTFVNKAKQDVSDLQCDDEDSCVESRHFIASSKLQQNPRISLALNGELDLYGFVVSQFSFTKLTAQNSQSNRKRCMVRSGSYWLRGYGDSASQLRRSECVKVESSEGALSLQFDSSNAQSRSLNVWYQGLISQIFVGTPEFATNKSPQIALWIISHPNIKIVISTLSAILATGLVIVKVRK